MTSMAAGMKDPRATATEVTEATRPATAEPPRAGPARRLLAWLRGDLRAALCLAYLAGLAVLAVLATVGLDAVFELMVDGAQLQVALEGLEGGLDFDELDVEAPQIGAIAAGQIGAQEIAPLAASDLPQPGAVEGIGEAGAGLVGQSRGEIHRVSGDGVVAMPIWVLIV